MGPTCGERTRNLGEVPSHLTRERENAEGWYESDEKEGKGKVWMTRAAHKMNWVYYIGCHFSGE
jgi:hypothetical protein